MKNSTASPEDFIDFALEHGALKLGSFTLKSGRTSPYFFDTGAFKDGAGLWRLGCFYAAAIVESEIEFDLLFGAAYKGIPLACVTAACLQREFGIAKDFAFNRKEAKDHGEKGAIVGAPLRGRVLMIDDVISAGTTVHETSALIKRHRAAPVGIVIALDREEKSLNAAAGAGSAARQIAAELGLRMISIATLSHLIEALERSGSREAAARLLQYRAQYGAP